MFLRGMVFFLLAIGFLGGCSPAPELPPFAAPAPTQVSSATPSAAPSLTPVLSATATPALTPFPPLSEKGPYLLVYRGQEDGLVVYDVHGFGRKKLGFGISDSIRFNPYLLYRLISPDAKWFVFHTFDAIDYSETLNILNISENTFFEVAEVIPSDSDERFFKMEEQLPTVYPKEFPPGAHFDVLLDFRSDIHNVAWSPDSRYLAFAGQIDGLSSDVYVYDLETRDIHRLNDDLLNVRRIEWSPDGQKILFTNTIPGEIYSSTSLHVLDLQAKNVKNPRPFESGAWWLLLGWLSPEKIFLVGSGDGGPWYDLRYLDLESNQMKVLWDGSFENFAIDVNNQETALATTDGLYVLGWNGDIKKISDSAYLYVAFRGGLKTRLIVNDGAKVYSIAHDGVANFLSNRGEVPLWSISPDKQWLVVYDKEGLDLFNASDELIATIPVWTETVSWNPDSSGFFLSDFRELYYVSLPYWEILSIDKCYTEDCYIDLLSAVWLP